MARELDSIDWPLRDESPFLGRLVYSWYIAVSTTIEDRFVLVLRETGEPYGVWQRLEELTGVVAARWRKAYTYQQRPTPDMIQALCRLKPEYAFWIATGITDAEHGHKAPESALPFPEWIGRRESDEPARNYFHASLELLERLARDGHVNVNNPEARLHAFGRERVAGHWQSSAIVSTAYKLARQSEYEALKQLREERKGAQRKVPAPKAPSATLKADPVLSSEDVKTKRQKPSDLFWVTNAPKADDAAEG